MTAPRPGLPRPLRGRGALALPLRPGGLARPLRARGGEAGQALLLLVAALAAVLVGAAILGAIARGVGARGDRQRAADLAALAGAQQMRRDYGRLFEPRTIGLRLNPRHLGKAAFLVRARGAARRTAARNGAERVDVAFPDAATFAPVRVRVAVADPIEVEVGGRRVTAPVRTVAEATLAPPLGGPALPAGAGEYRGPLALRQGKPMRPDVAAAFDRMAAAALREAGLRLLVTSGYRSNAEQARLFAARPDPKWVAPPGKSLHRLGTELDLGPDAAWPWLAANARRFHFVKRYAWEPWHYGFVLNAGSGSVGFGGDGRSGRSLPSFVPARFAPLFARAAMRWNVSGALLAAQAYAESGLNPFAVSPAGARGIAQFMPGTAAGYGLRDPFDPAAAIDAQARLMRDLLRRFGSVPLALAAYNAGPGAVGRCGCIPPYPETQGYVARILGLLGGVGDLSAGGGLRVRLVE